MEEEEAGQGLVRPGCGVLLGLQVLVGVHQEGRKGEGSGGEGEVAGPPLSLSHLGILVGLGLEGGVLLPVGVGLLLRASY